MKTIFKWWINLTGPGQLNQQIIDSSQIVALRLITSQLVLQIKVVAIIALKVNQEAGPLHWREIFRKIKNWGLGQISTDLMTTRCKHHTMVQALMAKTRHMQVLLSEVDSLFRHSISRLLRTWKSLSQYKMIEMWSSSESKSKNLWPMVRFKPISNVIDLMKT